MAIRSELSVLEELRGDRQIPIGFGIFTKREVSETIESVICETDEAIDLLPHARRKISIAIEKWVEFSLERILIDIPLTFRSVADRVALRLCFGLRLRYGERPCHQIVTSTNQLRERRMRVVLAIGKADERSQPAKRKKKLRSQGRLPSLWVKIPQNGRVLQDCRADHRHTTATLVAKIWLAFLSELQAHLRCQASAPAEGDADGRRRGVAGRLTRIRLIGKESLPPPLERCGTLRRRIGLLLIRMQRSPSRLMRCGMSRSCLADTAHIRRLRTSNASLRRRLSLVLGKTVRHRGDEPSGSQEKRRPM